MTLGINQLNNQALIMQQIRAAQSRVEKFQQELQNQKSIPQADNPPQVQQQQQQTPNNFDALNANAAMNIYNNKGLTIDQQQTALQLVQSQDKKPDNPVVTAKLEKARSDVQTQEKLLSEIQSNPENQNPEAKPLKEDQVFDKLPPELKARKDIGQIMKDVDSEALLDPEKAVDALVNEALAGSKKAFQKLEDYSKNPFDKLQQAAGQGLEKVIAGAEGRPTVLEMIAGTASGKSNEAAAKLMNLSDRNPRAQQGFERLLNSGAINFTKVAGEAKDMDPGRAASSINTLLLRGNMDKSDRKGAIGILGQIASESPTGAAGKDAAKGLTRAVLSEPLDIATQAATELKGATLSGNADALSGLQKVSESKDPSRAQLGLSQLGEVAMSGSANATAGLETIKSVAQRPGAAGKTKQFAVETLGKVANAGGSNGTDAAKTMSEIATNKNNPANAHAFNEIGKLNDSTLGIKPDTNNKQANLSDSETYKKVMGLQQQINSFNQQPINLLNMFAMQPA